METCQPQILAIDADTAGQRLDNYLLRILRGLPKSRIYRIVRRGEVRINGRRAKPQVRLKTGDQVRIPPIRHLPARSEAVGYFEDLDSLILLEDTHVLVLNKPAGMAVHGGSGVRAGVIESLRHARADLKSAELVHRLDRGTSGCLMVAKKRSYLKALQDALRQPGTILKTYIACVHGRLDGNFTVAEPLLTVSRAGQERFTRVDSAGKPASTDFRPLATGDGVSLVEAKPATGRTHQIRVHARWLRLPLLGDDRYGDEVRDSLFESRPPRLMLHARRLQVPAILDRPPLDIVAPVDDPFIDYLESTLSIDTKTI